MDLTGKTPEQLSIMLAENQQNITITNAQVVEATVGFQRQLNVMQEADTAIRAAIKTAMEERVANGLPGKYEDDKVSITYVKASQRRGLDTAKLKLLEPEIYAQYEKVTDVSASVRISIK